MSVGIPHDMSSSGIKEMENKHPFPHPNRNDVSDMKKMHWL